MKTREEIKTIALISTILLLALVVYFRVSAAPQPQEKLVPAINPPMPEVHYTHAVVVPETTPTPVVKGPKPQTILPAEVEPAETPEFHVDLKPIAPWDETAGFYRPDVPMPFEHQATLYEICEETGVDINLALGLIELESAFNPDAVSEENCYGLCQLNPRYFPANLSPEDNMRVGIGWLGELIVQYGDVAKALTVYHVGHDDGTRTYANVVLVYARAWGYAE